MWRNVASNVALIITICAMRRKLGNFAANIMHHWLDYWLIMDIFWFRKPKKHISFKLKISKEMFIWNKVKIILSCCCGVRMSPVTSIVMLSDISWSHVGILLRVKFNFLSVFVAVNNCCYLRSSQYWVSRHIYQDTNIYNTKIQISFNHPGDILTQFLERKKTGKLSTLCF